MKTTIDGLKDQLAQLQKKQASGGVTDAQFAEEKTALERQILELVLAGAPVGAAPPPAAKAKNTAATVAPEVPAAKPSLLLMVALGVGIVAIAGAGYLWKSSAGPYTGMAEAEQTAPAEGNQPSHSVTAEQIAAMTEKLAERLQQKPDDVEGWTMLARSYSVLGRQADALKAFKTASDLRKDDPALLADYADSLAVNNGSNLEGEPMKLVQRALKLDPKNLKALYLAGTYEFNRENYAGAIKLWEKLAEVGPPGNVFVNQVQGAIAEARSLAGMPAAAAPLNSATVPGLAAAPGAAAPASGASVSGTVTLSAALAKQAQPEDTVFVFARAVEGSRMPLAILRKQVKDLPITFDLNDSMAMSPATALSSQSQVIVGARISKSGNAMTQPGDLQGQSAPVKVGASGLKIEIKDAVK